jgi:hypothetical protein
MAQPPEQLGLSRHGNITRREKPARGGVEQSATSLKSIVRLAAYLGM